jgi:hypothetical protein
MSASIASPASIRASRSPSPRRVKTVRSASGIGSVSPTTATSTIFRSNSFFDPKLL